MGLNERDRIEGGVVAHLPVLWLGERWPELVTVELASFGGGRDSPERKKTAARGGSEGSTVSRQHQ